MLTLLLLACGADTIEVGYLAPLQIAPSDGSAEIDVGVSPHVVLNDGLSQWEGLAWLEGDDGRPLVAALAYDPDAWTLSLTPDPPLDRDSRYTLVLSGSLEGESLGLLPGEIRASFRTAQVRTGGPNDAPVADIAVDADCETGVLLGLDGSGSFDPDGEALDFRWRVASGNVELLVANTERVDLAVQGPGEAVVGLVVDDGELASEEAFLRLACR